MRNHATPGTPEAREQHHCERRTEMAEVRARYAPGTRRQPILQALLGNCDDITALHGLRLRHKSRAVACFVAVAGIKIPDTVAAIVCS
jgi:hypothetical protein